MKDKINEEFNHFCSRINFSKSTMDARAIKFMHEFYELIDSLGEVRAGAE